MGAVTSQDKPRTVDPDDGFTLDAQSDAYYIALGDGRYAPTLHAQGAWREDEQHMAPVSGIVAHALERHEPREGMQLARITYEILGMIPALPFEITCRTVRPGRTIELVEATMTCQGRAIVRATAWRLSVQETAEVQGGHQEPMPSPEDSEPWEGMKLWGGGYIASMEFRTVGDGVPGRGRAWMRPTKRLVDGEPASDTSAFLGVVDTANGIATREHPDEWLFPNVDLTIHLFRTPAAGWAGFDTDVTFGATGVGLTSTTLHDVHGPVGRAEQILTVRPR